MNESGVDEVCKPHDIVAEVVAAANDRFSIFMPESDISRINAAAGSGEWVTVAGETLDLLAFAVAVAEKSRGGFDPTIAPLMQLWGFRSSSRVATCPETALLQRTCNLVNWREVLLLPEAGKAQLARSGMALDLGGIAKGYAVDRACEALVAAGCDNFLVNLAGNMRGSGCPASGGNAWRIGVRDPLQAGAWLGAIDLRAHEGIATSGNYEQYVEIEGERYTHIIDPRSGIPVRGIISVTVVAGSAAMADGLSTALFVLGPAAGGRVLAETPGAGAVYLTADEPPQLLVTPALQHRFVVNPVWRHALKPIE